MATFLGLREYGTRRWSAVAVLTIAALLFPLFRALADGQWLHLSAYSGAPGAHLLVGGDGFQASEVVTVSFQGMTQTATTNTEGAFTGVDFVVPVRPAGSYALTATSPSGGSANGSYYIEGVWPSASPFEWWLPPGGTLGVNGTNFAPGETISLFVGDGSSAVATATADEGGSFSKANAITVPSAFANKQMKVTVKGDTSGATASFEIAVGGYWPSLSPSDYYAEPGHTIGVMGGGFAPDEDVVLKVGGTTIGTFAADATGTFAAPNSITIPFGSTSLTLTGVGQTSGASASADVEVGQLFPHVTPSAYYATPGQKIGGIGGGYAPGETIDIMDGATKLGSVTADVQGDFAAPESVTIGFDGLSKTIAFVGQTSNGSASFTVTVGQLFPGATPTAYFSLPGSTNGVSGTGFFPGETVRLEDAIGTLIATATADSDGNVTTLTDAITIPWDSDGNVVYYLKGLTSSGSASVSIATGGFSPSINPSTWYVVPDKLMSLTGTGYGPNESIDIKIDGVKVTGTTADENGTFTASFRAPKTGTHFMLGAVGLNSKGNAQVTISINQDCLVDEPAA